MLAFERKRPCNTDRLVNNMKKLQRSEICSKYDFASVQEKMVFKKIRFKSLVFKKELGFKKIVFKKEVRSFFFFF